MHIKLLLFNPGTVTSSMELAHSKRLEWPDELRIPVVNETICVEFGRGIIFRVEWKYAEQKKKEGPLLPPQIMVEIRATIY